MPQGVAAGRIELKPTQQRVLAVLNGGDATELTRGQYQQIAGVSRSQAAYDLAELVERGALERIGGGRSTRYRLVRRSQSSQRHWTNERIRSALADFCAGRKTWPSAADFKVAGHADLYVAASRYGGIGFWAAELGFERPGRASAPPAAVHSVRPRLRWAAAGAALAAVAFAGVGAALYPWHPRPSQKAAPRPAVPVAPKVKLRPPDRGRPVPKVSPRTTSAGPKQSRTRRHSTPRSSAAPQPAFGGGSDQAQLVAQKISQPKQVQTHKPALQSAASGTPTPMAAPGAGGAAVEPLPSPPRPLPLPQR
jgi:hypothetical protein